VASDPSAGPDAGASSPAAPELYPLHDDDPETIGPYRVVGRLGAGWSSVVYGAVDAQEQCLAVKVLRPEHAADAAQRAELPHLIDKLRRVEGVCATSVRAADPHATLPWVACDYSPGRNLQQHLQRGTPLRGAVLSAFAAGMAEALAAIHAVGLAHRDVKATNAVLGIHGPLLVDFGLDSAERPPGSGWLCPEGYIEGAVPTAESDVFGWGCLVVQAATGRHPFGSGSEKELRHRVLEAEPELDGLPQELRFSVTWALAKDPDDRPRATTLVRTLLSADDGDPDADDGAATV
jgi:eukaryotic-like serine/threonine-protein kinase